MPFRAVVVGAGGISNAWFDALKKEGVDIPAVVDVRIDAARAQIEKFGLAAEASTDLAATLDCFHPDFVADLTIPEAHCEVTCAALRAGCHVVGEKPMASSMEEARRMVRTAEETGKLYMVSQTRRWESKHEAIQRALSAGVIGDVTTVNCDFYLGAHFGGFRDEMPSPLILDMAIHHFDLARFMAGVDPAAVYAKEFNPRGSWYTGDAAASCVFEMSNGVVFTYRGSWCAEGFTTSWNGNWRIVGERGSLVYDNDGDPKAHVVAGGEGFQRPLKEAPVPPAVVEATGWQGAVREMLTFLSTGTLPQTECHDNIKSLAMVFGAMESSKRAARVVI